MGDILGIGVTHYPGLIQPDQQMAGLLDRTLNSDQVPAELKDPARWPEPMRKEWADPVAAAKEHRKRLVGGFRKCREALDAFVESTQKNLSGTATLSLYKGNISVVSRKSEFSLYRTDLSSFTMGDSYDQKDAAGFIRILGLPSRSRAQLRQEVTK